MTDIDTLAATVRAGLGEDWLRATAATEHFVDGGSLGFDTAHLPEPIRLHILRWTSHRAFKDVEAKRQLLDLLLAEPHHVADDQYYTCPAATQERDGGVYGDGDQPGSCSCGRDARVAVYLELLAQPYEEATE